MGRLRIESDLSVPSHPNIFAVGDLSVFQDEQGKPLPGIAPVAIQQGTHVGQLIRAELRGKPRKPFRYFDKYTHQVLNNRESDVKRRVRIGPTAHRPADEIVCGHTHQHHRYRDQCAEKQEQTDTRGQHLRASEGLLIVPSAQNHQVTNDANTTSGMSMRTSRLAMISGVTTAEQPRISRVLRILLPTTFPIAISGLSVAADTTDTANSGALVPNATTVKPMTSGEIPTPIANRDAP